MFEVDFDLDALRVSWDRAVNEVRTGVVRGVGYGARDGAAEARSRHTFTNRTGDLEKSIVHIPVGWISDSTYVANVRAGEKYASFVEKGTPPHLIPGNPFLTFEWKGELVHFRYVNHPGSKAKPFAFLVTETAEKVFLREMDLAIVRAQRILDR